MTLFDNILQQGVAVLLTALLSIPAGSLFLKLLRIDAPRWFMLLIAIPVGMLIFPLYFALFAFVTGSAVSTPARLILWIILWIVLAALDRLWIRSGAVEREPIQFHQRRAAIVLAAIAALAALLTAAPLLVHGLQTSAGIHYIDMVDWQKHIAVITALATDDKLPPPNVFLSSEPRLAYYYYAYMMPATLYRLTGAHLAPPNILAAHALLIAFTFPLLLYGYARSLRLTEEAALFTSGVTTLVGGLDFLFVLVNRLQTGSWASHIDFWVSHDDRRINALVDMFIWVPQHSLAFCGFIVALWFIRQISITGYWRDRLFMVAGLAVVLAALAGTSSFVWFGTLVAAAALIAFEGLYCLLKRRSLAVPLLLTAALIVSGLLSLPYLMVVLGRSEGAFLFYISKGPALRFGGIFDSLLGSGQLAGLLDFPLAMLIEFGFVLVAGLLGFWIMRRREPDRFELRQWGIMLLIFFLIALAVRPVRPDSNNYAARVAPLAWIILGILAGYGWMALREQGGIMRRRLVMMVLGGMIALGVLSTFYEPLVLLRHTGVISEDAYQAFQWINDHVSDSDLFQFDLWHGSMTDGHPLYLSFIYKRPGMASRFLGQLYAYDDDNYARMRAPAKHGFEEETPQASADLFREAGISYLILDVNAVLLAESDPDFGAYFEPVFANSAYRILHLRTAP